jgi:hypothetical protein
MISMRRQSKGNCQLPFTHKFLKRHQRVPCSLKVSSLCFHHHPLLLWVKERVFRCGEVDVNLWGNLFDPIERPGGDDGNDADGLEAIYLRR